MADTKYVLLKEMVPPEKCFLAELLLWRAFGRFPEEAYDNDNNDWRFSSDVQDDFAAQHPNIPALSNEECDYAGLPPDPRMIALLRGNYLGSIEAYDTLLNSIKLTSKEHEDSFYKLSMEKKLAQLHFAILDNWKNIHDNYTDQFKLEIGLKLRKGEFRGFGSKLPAPSIDGSNRIFEQNDTLINDLGIVEIPSAHWISSSID